MFKILISESLYNQVITSEGSKSSASLENDQSNHLDPPRFSQSLAKLYDHKVISMPLMGNGWRNVLQLEIV